MYVFHKQKLFRHAKKLNNTQNFHATEKVLVVAIEKNDIFVASF